MARLFLKTPLAILATGAEGGLVGEDGGSPNSCRRQPALGARRRDVRRLGPCRPAGLVNTHHHFYQTLTRAHPQAIDKELFPWLQALYPIWARLDPESFRLSVRLALTELLLSGCTTAADHHYLFPQGLGDAIDVEAEEARSLGIRVTLTRGSMNLSQKDGGLPPIAWCRTRTRSSPIPSALLSTLHEPGEGAMCRWRWRPARPFPSPRA